MLCSSKDRKHLFEEHVRTIKEGMKTRYTDLDLANLVVKYLRAKRNRECVQLGVPDHMTRLAQTQDAIG